jgi:hypothetical protein
MMLNCSQIRASSGNLAGSSNVTAVPVDTYIWGMSRSAPSSATPDLFDYVSSTPAQRIRRTLPDVKRSVPELGQLSDARLARRLRELTSELQRRKVESTGRASQSELDQAIQDAVCALENLVPRQAGRTRRSKGADAAPQLQEPRRKAIRAAHAAGVAPSQVARHFGLPLAAVRKVLTGAE